LLLFFYIKLLKELDSFTNARSINST